MTCPSKRGRGGDRGGGGLCIYCLPKRACSTAGGSEIPLAFVRHGRIHTEISTYVSLVNSCSLVLGKRAYSMVIFSVTCTCR